MSLCLTWAHLGVAGLAADVAGAVVLGLSFSTKRPEAIRTEVPKTLETTFAYAILPQGLAHSMIRQRAEARLGLTLLVVGFLMQAANPLFDLGSLTTAGQRVVAVGLALGIWALAWLAMLTYVPADEARTHRRMQELEREAGAD